MLLRYKDKNDDIFYKNLYDRYDFIYHNENKLSKR